jgi:pimeloyl-ACP methyl ester carboxylesterase
VTTSSHTPSPSTSIQVRFRSIDGLSVRFAESGDRDDHALLLSPRAMGEFIIRAADAFGLEHPHVVGPDIGTAADPRQIVAGALAGIERYQLPDAVREDYLSSYEGDRMVESMRYVRAYPAELPVLADLLPQIQTAVQIVAGRHDPAVPPVNAEFLHDRLPHSKLDLLDAGHFTWEDAPDEYAALVTSWWDGGYATTGTVKRNQESD